MILCEMRECCGGDFVSGLGGCNRTEVKLDMIAGLIFWP